MAREEVPSPPEMRESAAHGQPLFASSRLLTFAPQLDLRYTPTTDGQDSSEARRARSTPLEDHLGGSLGTNASNPRQLSAKTVQLLTWAQKSGWLIDSDDGQDPATLETRRQASHPLDPSADSSPSGAQRLPATPEGMLPWAKENGWLISARY